MWHIDLPACCALALKMVYPVPDRVLVSNLPDDLARKAYFIPMPDVKSALRAAVSKPGGWQAAADSRDAAWWAYLPGPRMNRNVLVFW